LALANSYRIDNFQVEYVVDVNDHTVIATCSQWQGSRVGETAQYTLDNGMEIWQRWEDS